MNKQKKIILALVAVAVVLVAVLTVNNYRPIESEEQSLDEVEVTDSAEVEEITYKYGIPVDKYNVKYGIVKPNQNLSFILSDHGLSAQNIHDLNLKTEGVFDVRKIRSGRAYAMFTSKDSLATPKFFVYEEDPKSYVVFDLRGEYKVTRGQNPVEWRTKEAKGKINSSLWVAMQDCNTSPQLAIVLSHIFGWTIDFFGLQKEDEFRVIYEQEYAAQLSQSVELAETVAAPVAQGDTLGTLTVTAGEETVAKIPIVAGEDVARVTFSQMFARLLRLAFLGG